MRMRSAFAATALAAVSVVGAAGVANADANASGLAAGSPGVLSGNNVQVPINLQLQVCGNTVKLVGLLNPAFGNVCIQK
ncbi:chaplin [Streptomyces sp. 8K308]|uniref:chaplin n=1 Tax=Streptomyces sp. 8K308 TaxID=2530388 RepID=UPI00104F31D6|nr:chaplin [Streptomyces sp. 8K308]TDC19220.1 chaplin [Streptomyces sp. 8K308]